MSSWNMINIQDGSSPIMEQMNNFHDHAMMFIMMIIILIMCMMMLLSINKINNNKFNENQTAELLWTTLPILILIMLVIPSLKVLYLSDEMNLPKLTIKTIGNQWYWNYEYSDFKNIEFSSFMIKNYKKTESFRLLDVDNIVTLPNKTKIRMIINSDDVIHSWTIPSLGVKIDAMPGRLNQTQMSISKSGMFFGQCSEICGMNHSFMPISIESTNMDHFKKFIKKF
uniref:Cytochrome c oxidase subunit 2 n=1 Tax=Schlettererius cinctipes TaxID=32424 RepID=C4NCF7_9HYME|nr:cytochrome c oxidase subunit II [Schlettererius cinctipes]